ncbi:hypothetical protein PMAYCL1PPCAC_14875, partial [Pristionchus mayeri]
LHTKAFPAHATTETAARAEQVAAAAAKPSPAVNPDFYRRMMRFIELDRQDSTFSGCVWDGKLTRVDENKLSAEFVVNERQADTSGVLHGGCTTTLVDMLTCAALISATGNPALSVNLGMSYMNPAPIGSLVRLDAEVVKVSRSLAYTSAELVRVDDGAQIASAKHTLAFNERVTAHGQVYAL